MNQELQERIKKAITIDKKPVKQVADALFMTESQLKVLLTEWCIDWKQRKRFKSVDRPDRSDLLNKYFELKTVQSVASHYGTGYNQVMKWMVEYKIPTKKMKMSEEDMKKYLEDHLSQLSNINL